MRDAELFTRILGLDEPWFVEQIEPRLEDSEVVVWIGLRSGAEVCCPHCGRASPRYDERKRRWRHLDLFQYRTILEAEVPRVDCEEHGVVQAKVPWADGKSSLTLLFEQLVIDWLQVASIADVARQTRLSWGAVSRVMERAVTRGLGRREVAPPEKVGVDETSFKKRHKYLTVVSDLERGVVLDVAEERTEEALKQVFGGLPLDSVKAVAMDMWQPFIAATLSVIPNAEEKICFDKYHVAWHLGQAVDTVRKQEHRELQQEGPSVLKKKRFLFLSNPKNLDRSAREELKALKAIARRTGRAWSFKLTAMSLWDYSSRAWAKKAWEAWYASAIHSSLLPVKKAARTVKKFLWGIINAVVLKVTNARAENRNAAIQDLKRQARGFRSFQRMRNAILFRLGALDLAPVAHTHSIR